MGWDPIFTQHPRDTYNEFRRLASWLTTGEPGGGGAIAGVLSLLGTFRVRLDAADVTNVGGDTIMANAFDSANVVATGVAFGEIVAKQFKFTTSGVYAASMYVNMATNDVTGLPFYSALLGLAVFDVSVGGGAVVTPKVHLNVGPTYAEGQYTQLLVHTAIFAADDNDEIQPEFGMTSDFSTDKWKAFTGANDSFLYVVKLA